MPTKVTRGVTSGADGVLERLASRNHLTAVIMAAMAANMVGTLQLAAVAAFSMGFVRQRLMAASHASARGRRLTFRNSHGTESFVIRQIMEEERAAPSSRPIQAPQGGYWLGKGGAGCGPSAGALA